MLNILFSLLVVALIVIMALALRKPDEFRVTRSATFKAPVDKIFPYLNNKKLSHQWSPWVRMEPEAQYVFTGPEEGVGAGLTWEGKKTGAGKLVVTESEPNKRVRFRLEFIRPMKAVNTAEYMLMEQGNSTVVTWTMFGPNNFIGKVMSLFMNCEKMVGDQFEQGFRNLKEIVEK